MNSIREKMSVKTLIVAVTLLFVSIGITTSTIAGEANDTKCLTIAEKLELKMKVDFKNVPLQKAYAEISKQSGIPITIIADALKFEGLTLNLTQTLDLGEVTVKEVLEALAGGKANSILSQEANKGILIYVLNEKEDGLIVSTANYAKDKGQKPYDFKNQNSAPSNEKSNHSDSSP